MKKLLLVLFFLCYSIGNSQTSTYNKGLKPTVKKDYNKWGMSNGFEYYLTEQTPVGYKKAYEELKKVLSFYSLEIVESEIDESLIDSSVSGLKDFTTLSNSMLLQMSEIKMVWRTSDGYQINFTGTDGSNFIGIRKI